MNNLNKSIREIELEIMLLEKNELLLQNKLDAIELKYMLENAIFVKNKFIKKVEGIITTCEKNKNIGKKDSN